jgi:hypothetical protein
MTDAECTEPEPEDVPSDDLVAIAVDATDLRPAALRGIAEMLEEDFERRMELARMYREQAAEHESRSAREQAVLDALFALPAGAWVARDKLAQDLGVEEWEISCAIDALVARRWPIHVRHLNVCGPWEYRLQTPSAQARLVGGATDGRE